MFDRKIIEEYLENRFLKKNLSNVTMEAYEKDIFDFVDYMEEKNHEILNFSQENINEYFNFLKEKNKSSTFKRKYSSIKNFYKYLLKNRYTQNLFSFKLEDYNLKNSKIEPNKNSKNYTLEDYNKFLASLDNDLIFKIIIKLVVELKIKLSEVFKIQIRDLIKYDFKQIIIIKNNKVVTYETNTEIENLLRTHYNEFAKEKRFLFGIYNRSRFYSDLKKNNLNLETLKKSQTKNEKELEESISEKYFEIGIGDK